MQIKMLTFIFLVLDLFLMLNAESLLDLPFQIPNRNLIIEATLTDNSTGELFFLQESITTIDSATQGKIEIDSKLDSYNVHYRLSMSDAYRAYERLVVQETQCDLYTYRTEWDNKLPNVAKPLLNLILLMGPSVFYRVNHYTIDWMEGEDSSVRGTMMHSAQITMNQRLKITYFYKASYDLEEGILFPSRIVFDGYDPGNLITSSKETLVMDIYMLSEPDTELDTIVQVTPGIGCPVYLSPTKAIPAVLRSDQIQFIVQENVYGAATTSVRDEVYIDDNQAVMRRITTMLGFSVDAIYDYNLGQIYVLQDHQCIVQPLGANAPGISENGVYSIYNLLWLDKVYMYLGQVNFDGRPGFRVDAWESVEYDSSNNVTTKSVTTIYMAYGPQSDLKMSQTNERILILIDQALSSTFRDHILVGSARREYKKGSSGNYILVQTTKRYYYDFKAANSDDEFNDRFNLNDCYGSDGKINLAFQLTCDGENCMKNAERNLNLFKRVFKNTIISDFKISPLRIPNIDFAFSLDKITAYVTFLEKPRIQESVSKKFLYLQNAFLNKLGPISVTDETTCLDVQSSFIAPIRNVIYCPKDNRGTCYHLEKSGTLVEDIDGTRCSVFDFPLNNLYRLATELSLKEIHDNMLKKTRYSITFYRNNYRIQDVQDVTQVINDDTQFPFSVSRHSCKLKSDGGGLRVAAVERVSNFGDCGRACLHSDESYCESFSYCTYAGKIECLVTSSMYDDIAENVTVDENCNIYSKNHLDDYFKISEKRFKTPTSVTVDIPLEDCATFCYASTECYSFQYCRGMCTFGGFYTDSLARSDELCDIHAPKVSQRYQITGQKIVQDTFHTEIDINMEQCAALCYGQTSECKSFNYCPKGKTASECSLSGYSVDDVQTVTIDSSGCQNYQLTEKQGNSNKALNNGIKTSQGTSTGAAFGIIVLFLVSGLIVGFVVPIAIAKVKSLQIGLLPSLPNSFSNPLSNELGFSWTRQVNDEEDNQTEDKRTTVN